MTFRFFLPVSTWNFKNTPTYCCSAQLFSQLWLLCSNASEDFREVAIQFKHRHFLPTSNAGRRPFEQFYDLLHFGCVRTETAVQSGGRSAHVPVEEFQQRRNLPCMFACTYVFFDQNQHKRELKERPQLLGRYTVHKPFRRKPLLHLLVLTPTMVTPANLQMRNLQVFVGLLALPRR